MIACEPALTSPEKVRRMFQHAGVQICSLGTGIRFDQIVSPPVIGRVISDTERSVREAKGMVDLAVQLECPYVRVFGFELPEGERRVSGMGRVVERLVKAADYCRNSGVKLAIENGGSFPKAVDLAEIIDSVGSAMVVASYCPAVAAMSGEDVAAGVNVLGEKLALVKLKDMRGGKPVVLGEGELRCRETVRELQRVGYEGWLVHEFDRAWLPDIDGASTVDVDSTMRRSSAALFDWLGNPGAMGARTVARATGV
jgi:sugar phosphate isomerase/epimerase